VRFKGSFFSAVIVVALLTLIPTSSAGLTPGKGPAQRRKQVKVYFYHDPGEYIDLAPVKRYVNPASPARAAIIALLNGPTAEERRRGFDGLASASDFSIGSLKITDGTARINFVVSRTWMGFAGDLAPIRFKKAVELTLKQFSNVSRVIVTLNGDPNFDGD
jgi:spore germination protein GerM